MTTHRSERVADQVRRNLAKSISEELRDPRIGFVTITAVKLSPDLRNATVFVTVMPTEQRADSIRALNRSIPFLRRSLAREGGLRFTPSLRFCYDEAFESGQRVEEFLRTVRRDPAEPSGETDDGTG